MTNGNLDRGARKFDLFSDYKLELGRSSPSAESEAFVYLKSDGFFDVISQWESPEFRAMPRRKLRKDSTGTLAMCLAAFEGSELGSVMISGGVRSTISSLVAELSKGALSIREGLFEDNIFGLAPIEGLWVYIYLSVDAGLSYRDILRDVRKRASRNPMHNEWRGVDSVSDMDLMGAILRIGALRKGE